MRAVFEPNRIAESINHTKNMHTAKMIACAIIKYQGTVRKKLSALERWAGGMLQSHIIGTMVENSDVVQQGECTPARYV